MDKKVDPWGGDFFLLLAATAFYNWRGFEQYIIHANSYTFMCLTVAKESSIAKHLFCTNYMQTSFIFHTYSLEVLFSIN